MKGLIYYIFQTRKLLGGALCLVGNLGTLITYFIGIFVNWRQLAFIMFSFAIPYVLGILIFLPKDYKSTKIHTIDIATIENCMKNSEDYKDSENSKSPKLPKRAENINNAKNPEKLEKSGNSETSANSKNSRDSKNSGNSKDTIDSKNSRESKNSGNSKNSVNFNNSSNSQLPEVFKYKKLYLCSGIILFYQFAGCNVITKYASTILQSERNQFSTIFGQLDPALVNSTFVGLAGLIGVILGVIFVQYGFQRRTLLLNSAMGTSVAFLILGLINSEIRLTDGDTQCQLLCTGDRL